MLHVKNQEGPGGCYFHPLTHAIWYVVHKNYMYEWVEIHNRIPNSVQLHCLPDFRVKCHHLPDFRVKC